MFELILPRGFRRKPKGWGEDGLSRYIDGAYNNCRATFERKRERFDRLVAIHDAFENGADKWTNPTSPIAALLYVRAQGAFMAASQHAMAGQMAETYPLIRCCLEYAGYALHIAKNDALSDVWLNRHDDDRTLARAKSEFRISEIRKTINLANNRSLEIFDTLYQQAIDMGGHANERAMSGSLDIIERDGGKEFRQQLLHGDGVAMEHALLSCARAGVCALEILQEAFPERFELLGLRHQLPMLRQGL